MIRRGADRSTDDQQYVLSLVGDLSSETRSIADRLDGLNGMTIGLLHNTKTNTDIFLEEMGNALTAKFGVETTIYRRKDGTVIPVDSIATTYTRTAMPLSTRTAIADPIHRDACTTAARDGYSVSDVQWSLYDNARTDSENRV